MGLIYLTHAGYFTIVVLEHHNSTYEAGIVFRGRKSLRFEDFDKVSKGLPDNGLRFEPKRIYSSKNDYLVKAIDWFDSYEDALSIAWKIVDILKEQKLLSTRLGYVKHWDERDYKTILLETQRGLCVYWVNKYGFPQEW